MGQNNGNRPKLEPELNQEVRVRLVKDKPFTGENGFGRYFLYSVQNAETGEELAFFAPPEIHQIIVDKGLSKGSEFIVRKIPYQNGNKKITSKLELSLVGVAAHVQPSVTQPSPDGLKELMIQSMKDAAEVVAAVPELGFRAEDARAIGLSIYISKTKQF